MTFLSESTNQTCPNCMGRHVQLKYLVAVTRKHFRASLCHCLECDFLFLANPTWLEYAYSVEFLGDTGYVKRNLDMSRKLRLLFRTYRAFAFHTVGPACDLGTGVGLLPRMMRDRGYNFYGYDPFSNTQLISPFLSDATISRFKILTAFEVIEHVPSLPDFFRRYLKGKEVFVFSTILRDQQVVPTKDWWYYAFKNGQHISFHSALSVRNALALSGHRDYFFISYKRTLHIVTQSKLWLVSSLFAFFLWSLVDFYSRVLCFFQCLFFNECSLIEQDFRTTMETSE
jgi:hypothetical protein